MKLGDFKAALRDAPEVKAKEWKKALPDDSMNCPDCLGTGKLEGTTPQFNCGTCGGTGLQLSGAPKRKQTKSDRTKEIAKLLEGGAITIPAGTKMSLEGPIKGRKATLMIIDDPIMDRTERARVDEDAVGVLSAFKKRHDELEADPKKRSEAGAATTDFLEDLFGTEDRRPATTRCTACGSDVRRYQPDDHYKDCSLVKLKKCRVCAAEMGLCFREKSGRAWICKPCARAKYRSRR